MKIMFVCTGNICRSAMAEGILKKICKDKNLDIDVCSAGIYADTGDMATYNAIEAATYYDVDISSHHATNIRDSRINEMDIILCATNNHKLILKNMYPELKEKIYTMKEYAKLDNDGKDMDINDPWGYSMSVYLSCINEIQNCLNELIKVGI